MPRTPKSLNGKLATITGGARGIGRATATAMLARGMRVAIGDVDLELATKTAAELGTGAHAYHVDVTDSESFARFLDTVEAEHGPIDVHHNNAGVMQIGCFVDEPTRNTQRMIDINVNGMITGCRLILPRFIARGHGHLVNTSSAAAKGGYPALATYSGTKFFVLGFSESLRHELRGTGVDISVVMPGPVNTELSTGVDTARGFGNIEPSEVADAIIAALERPRFDVFVPRFIGPMTAFNGLLPRRVQDLGAKFTRADRVAVDAAKDPARLAYDERVASTDKPGKAVSDEARGVPAATS